MNKTIPLALSFLLLLNPLLSAQTAEQKANITRSNDLIETRHITIRVIQAALVAGGVAAAGIGLHAWLESNAPIYKQFAKKPNTEFWRTSQSLKTIGVRCVIAGAALVLLAAVTNIFDAQAAEMPKPPMQILSRNPALWLDQESFPDNQFLLVRSDAEAKALKVYLDNYKFFTKYHYAANTCVMFDEEKIKRETYAKAGVTKITAEDLEEKNFVNFLNGGAWPTYFAVFRANYTALAGQPAKYTPAKTK